jgi:hypothetical protein
MSTIHIDQMTLNVYPNPTTDVLTVAFDKVYSNLPYSVYDQNGRLVKSGELNKLVNFLDFSDLNQGFYLIKIKNEIVKIQVLKK